MPVLGTGVDRGRKCFKPLPHHLLFFLQFSGIAAKPPLPGSLTTAQGRGFYGGAPYCQSLWHRVELGGGQENWRTETQGLCKVGRWRAREAEAGPQNPDRK